VHDVIVMVVHEDGDRLPYDQRHPHSHVARLAVEEAIHKHGKRYLQTWHMSRTKFLLQVQFRKSVNVYA